jgi:mono/diheme cytochrome c family protein
MKKSRLILITVVVISALGLGVLGYLVLGPGAMDFAGGKRVALSAYQRANPSGVPAELMSASELEKGEYLARAADCMVCHTAKGGNDYAGGRGFVLPFGTLYSTNITPDKETGIGTYSDEDFLNAMFKGVGRGGVKLYPAMPYPSYTFMAREDALAIKAYLFSLPPLSAKPPENTLAFPFNQRWLMGPWAAMFNPDKRFEPRPERSPEWNRGAYLVEAMEHCGECHTPRTLAFSLNHRRKFAGAIQAGWHAYNITPDQSTGVGDWSNADLEHYLSMGHAAGRGTASGPMGEAVDESLSHLKPSDISAIVVYLRSVAAVRSSDLPLPKSQPASASFDNDGTGNSRGKAVYEGACAGCHGWSGVSPVLPFAALVGTRGINDPSATNVAQVIISGGGRHVADETVYMPGFGTTYSDSEIASVANYVTARFGAKGSTLNAADVDKMRKAD